MANASILLNGEAFLDNVAPGTVVTVTNADNSEATSWRWSLTAPDGSSAEIADPAAVSTMFVTDVEGGYRVRLTVNEGESGEASASAVVRVRSRHLGLPLLAKGETNEGHATQGWAAPLREAFLTIDKAFAQGDRITVAFAGTVPLTGPTLLMITGVAPESMWDGATVPLVDRAGITGNGALVFYEGTDTVNEGDTFRALVRGVSLPFANTKGFGKGDIVFSSGTTGGIERTAPNINAAVHLGHCVDVIGADMRIFFNPTVRLRRASLPSPIGSSGSAGTSGEVAPADHVHAHGNLGGGNMHALAVPGGSAGFMSGEDKEKLDALSGSAGHGNLGGGSLHATATQEEAGFMSPEDKEKLDNLPESYEHGEQAGGNLHPVATTEAAGFMSPLHLERLTELWERPSGSFDPTELLRFFHDDFIGVGYDDRIWRKLGGKVEIYTDEPHGVAAISTDAEFLVGGLTNNLLVPVSRRLVFEARVRVSDFGASNERQIRFGLGADIDSPLGCIEFCLDFSASMWQAQVISEGGGTSYEPLEGIAADEKFHVFRITADNEHIVFFVDGEPVAEMGPEVSDGVFLSPFIRIQSASGSEDTVDVDYIMVRWADGGRE